MNADLVLALDPGSVQSGWAALDCSERICEAGILSPDIVKAESQFRIARMCEDLLQLLAEWEPGTIVIEWTSGKVGRRRHKGQGAGLAVHGAATGALWQAAESWRRSLPAEQQSETQIVLVNENTWTNGVPKPDRLAGIAAVFPQYDVRQDPRGDIGDAIGLALWYLRENRLHQAEGGTREVITTSGAGAMTKPLSDEQIWGVPVGELPKQDQSRVCPIEHLRCEYWDGECLLGRCLYRDKPARQRAPGRMRH